MTVDQTGMGNLDWWVCSRFATFMNAILAPSYATIEVKLNRRRRAGIMHAVECFISLAAHFSSEEHKSCYFQHVTSISQTDQSLSMQGGLARTPRRPDRVRREGWEERRRSGNATWDEALPCEGKIGA